MPTLADLRADVIGTVLDSSFTQDKIDALLNEALVDVSFRVLLPDLETSDVVTLSGETSAALPDDYGRGLFTATVGGVPAWVCLSMKMLSRRFPAPDRPAPGITGQYVCVRGKTLEVRPAVSGDIELHYYALPETMAEDDHIPECLPRNKQRTLPHAYACAEVFNVIERGEEGQKRQSKEHLFNYEVDLKKLNDQVKSGQSHPEPIRDALSLQRI